MKKLELRKIIREEIKILVEEKTMSFEAAMKFAKKYKIKFLTQKNRFNGKEEVVFYGSAQDFFNEKRKSKFVQITGPSGFDKNSTKFHNIGIAIPADAGKSWMVNYEVNKE